MRWTVQKVCEYKIPNVYLVLFYTKMNLSFYIYLSSNHDFSIITNINSQKHSNHLYTFYNNIIKSKTIWTFYNKFYIIKQTLQDWRKRWETSIIKSQYLLIYNTKSIIPFNLLLYFHILLYISPPSLSIICKILYNISISLKYMVLHFIQYFKYYYIC